MDSNVKVTKKEVLEFLNKIKVMTDDKFHIIKRLKEPHKDPFIILNKMGYDVSDLIDEVKKLTVEDYLRCQIDSKNKFQFMYCFIKMIQKYLIFIKLSIVEDNGEFTYIISFHEAEKTN